MVNLRRILLAGAALLCAPGLFAAESLPLPASVTLESGTIRLRLDGSKFGNLSRISRQGRQLGVDRPESQYGTVVKLRGEKGFVGSGHRETGHTEQVESCRLTVDGREVDFLQATEVKGEVIEFTKVSRLRNFKLIYTLRLAGDIIDERAEISSETAVRLERMYHFMHPWRTAFTDLHVDGGDGESAAFRFRSDNRFPIRAWHPVAAFYNRDNGDGVVTVYTPGEGASARPERFVWDRKNYRKDYFVDYTDALFPAGHRAAYRAVTGFFTQPDPAVWIETARRLAAELKEK